MPHSAFVLVPSSPLAHEMNIIISFDVFKIQFKVFCPVTEDRYVVTCVERYTSIELGFLYKVCCFDSTECNGGCCRTLCQFKVFINVSLLPNKLSSMVRRRFPHETRSFFFPVVMCVNNI